MSADLLREAAEAIRRDWPVGEFCPDHCKCEQDGIGYHPQAEFHVAVADWLAEVTEHFPPSYDVDSTPPARYTVGYKTLEDRAALAVARAYLGRSATDAAA